MSARNYVPAIVKWMVEEGTKRCAKCGAVMHNVSVARKYCDFCRFGYATNDPVLPLVHPKYTGPTLQEIMREATKEGLQYAEYCKKHGLH